MAVKLLSKTHLVRHTILNFAIQFCPVQTEKITFMKMVNHTSGIEYSWNELFQYLVMTLSFEAEFQNYTKGTQRPEE